MTSQLIHLVLHFDIENAKFYNIVLLLNPLSSRLLDDLTNQVIFLILDFGAEDADFIEF
jgi:hypothetical protein